jgi:Flp pilus assembly protein TadG
MRKIHRNGRRGSAIVEFALAGIPLIFIWISIVQMAIGMWNYHTLQYAAKVAGAYAAVHGITCVTSTNSCSVSIKDIAAVFKTAAIGQPASGISMTFTTDSGVATTCNLGGSTNLCSSYTSAWPPSGDNQIGKTLAIRADYTFSSALSMVTLGPNGGVVKFASAGLPGDTKQIIQY